MSDEQTNFYQIDEKMIEEKYILAEARAQEQAIIERKQREMEERQAFVEAERQRKAADAERKRRMEEQERMDKIEQAKAQRSEEEKRRKEQEAVYQNRIADIESEISDLQARQANFLTDKVNLAKEHQTEQSQLQGTLDEIMQEKREIMDREQKAMMKIQHFQQQAAAQKSAIDRQQQEAEARLKEITLERRQVQTQMLNFLQNPMSATQPVQPPTNISPNQYSMQNPGPSAPMPQPQPHYQPFPQQQPPSGYPGYPGGQMQAHNPAANNWGPNPSAPMMVQKPSYMQNQNAKTDAPAYPEDGPSVQIIGDSQQGVSTGDSGGDTFEKQMKLFDDFLAQGVFSKEEYEANKKELEKAHGRTGAPAKSAKQMEVDKQLASLEQLRSALGEVEYQDARKKIFEDAGIPDGNAPASGGATNNVPVAPIAPVSNKNALVSVVCPVGSASGSNIVIQYNGKHFNVTVPPGITAGQQFQASVPI